jgi:cell division protein FtsW
MFHNAALNRSSLAPVDWALLWATAALLGMGLVMVYSASIAIAEAKSANNQPAFYLIRHAMYLVVGVAVAYAAFQIPTAIWQKLAPVVFMLGTISLVLVLIPFLGKEVYGARRWIPLGPIGNFQPSELMKFATILYAADYTVRKAAQMQNLKHGFLPMFGVMVIIGALFAVVHGNLPALLPLWAFSILLCLAYELTGCLWVAVGMHLFFHAANIVLMLMPEGVEW